MGQMRESIGPQGALCEARRLPCVFELPSVIESGTMTRRLTRRSASPCTSNQGAINEPLISSVVRAPSMNGQMQPEEPQQKGAAFTAEAVGGARGKGSGLPEIPTAAATCREWAVQ